MRLVVNINDFEKMERMTMEFRNKCNWYDYDGFIHSYANDDTGVGFDYDHNKFYIKNNNDFHVDEDGNIRKNNKG